ncbi:MAG: hypothetical protein J7521_07595 [Caulobacter sp.]|nr:hypothetical protein [Caulobacter sp.]
MGELTYRIVPHDGGFAYSADGVFSETFVSHDAAFAAACTAAAEQRAPGETVGIVYEDAAGHWRAEIADGRDRPTTHVVD